VDASFPPYLVHLDKFILLIFGKELFVCFGATARNGTGPPQSRCFYIILDDAPQLVGLLWTSDQCVTETST
jgi:hypothetical protein